MKVKLDKGAFAPIRCHDTDGGLVIRSPMDIFVPPSYVEHYGEFYSSFEKFCLIIDTGVHIELPHVRNALLLSKPKLAIKPGITCEGIIYQGYTSSLKVKLCNNTTKDSEIKRGEKIAQLLVPLVFVEAELSYSPDDIDREIKFQVVLGR